MLDELSKRLEEAGCSRRTARAYASDLADLNDWVTLHPGSGGPASLASLDTEQLAAYCDYLRTHRRLGQATVRRRIAAYRAYIRLETGQRSRSAPLPRSSVTPLRFLSVEDEERLLEAAWRRVDIAELSGRKREIARHRRNLALVLLLLRAGLRASEAVSLRRGDIVLPPGLVQVAGRSAPLDEKSASALERCLAPQAEHGPADHRAPVFSDEGQDGLGVRTAQLTIASLAREASLGRSVSPSMLRSTHALRLHQAGTSVRDIAERLGMRAASLEKRLPAPGRVRPRSARTTFLANIIPSAIRQCFDGFIGNESVVKRVCLLIAGNLESAKERTPFNVLFVGPSGSGKTELAERAARALELPLLERDGPEIRSRDQLIEDMLALASDSGQPIERLERSGELPVLMLPRMALFIDEIHALSRDVVDSLLKLTEPNRHRHEGRDRVIDASRVRFIGATTEFGQMPEAFENRFRPFELEPYSIEDVVEMLKLWQGDLPEEVYEPLALAGHLIPRSTRLLADEVANAIGQARRYTEAAGGRRIEPRDIVQELLGELGIDELGLSTLDRKYLGILCQSERAVGIDRLANELGRREGQVSGYIEPFLIRLGFVQRSDRGRLALTAGRKFLESSTPEQVATAIERLRRRQSS